MNQDFGDCKIFRITANSRFLWFVFSYEIRLFNRENLDSEKGGFVPYARYIGRKIIFAVVCVSQTNFGRVSFVRHEQRRGNPNNFSSEEQEKIRKLLPTCEVGFVGACLNLNLQN